MQNELEDDDVFYLGEKQGDRSEFLESESVSELPRSRSSSDSSIRSLELEGEKGTIQQNNQLITYIPCVGCRNIFPGERFLLIHLEHQMECGQGILNNMDLERMRCKKCLKRINQPNSRVNHMYALLSHVKSCTGVENERSSARRLSSGWGESSQQYRRRTELDANIEISGPLPCNSGVGNVIDETRPVEEFSGIRFPRKRCSNYMERPSNYMDASGMVFPPSSTSANFVNPAPQPRRCRSVSTISIESTESLGLVNTVEASSENADFESLPTVTFGNDLHSQSVGQSRKQLFPVESDDDNDSDCVIIDYEHGSKTLPNPKPQVRFDYNDFILRDKENPIFKHNQAPNSSKLSPMVPKRIYFSGSTQKNDDYISNITTSSSNAPSTSVKPQATSSDNSGMKQIPPNPDQTNNGQIPVNEMVSSAASLSVFSRNANSQERHLKFPEIDPLTAISSQAVHPIVAIPSPATIPSPAVGPSATIPSPAVGPSATLRSPAVGPSAAIPSPAVGPSATIPSPAVAPTTADPLSEKILMPPPSTILTSPASENSLNSSNVSLESVKSEDDFDFKLRKRHFSHKELTTMIPYFLKNPNAPWVDRAQEISEILGIEKFRIQNWLTNTRALFKNGNHPPWALEKVEGVEVEKFEVIHVDKTRIEIIKRESKTPTDNKKTRKATVSRNHRESTSRPVHPIKLTPPVREEEINKRPKTSTPRSGSSGGDNICIHPNYLPREAKQGISYKEPETEDEATKRRQQRTLISSSEYDESEVETTIIPKRRMSSGNKQRPRKRLFIDSSSSESDEKEQMASTPNTAKPREDLQKANTVKHIKRPRRLVIDSEESEEVVFCVHTNKRNCGHNRVSSQGPPKQKISAENPNSNSVSKGNVNTEEDKQKNNAEKSKSDSSSRKQGRDKELGNMSDKDPGKCPVVKISSTPSLQMHLNELRKSNQSRCSREKGEEPEKFANRKEAERKQEKGPSPVITASSSGKQVKSPGEISNPEEAKIVIGVQEELIRLEEEIKKNHMHSNQLVSEVQTCKKQIASIIGREPVKASSKQKSSEKTQKPNDASKNTPADSSAPTPLSYQIVKELCLSAQVSLNASKESSSSVPVTEVVKENSNMPQKTANVTQEHRTQQMPLLDNRKELENTAKPKKVYFSANREQRPHGHEIITSANDFPKHAARDNEKTVNLRPLPQLATDIPVDCQKHPQNQQMPLLDNRKELENTAKPKKVYFSANREQRPPSHEIITSAKDFPRYVAIENEETFNTRPWPPIAAEMLVNCQKDPQNQQMPPLDKDNRNELANNSFQIANINCRRSVELERQAMFRNPSPPRAAKANQTPANPLLPSRESTSNKNFKERNFEGNKIFRGRGAALRGGRGRGIPRGKSYKGRDYLPKRVNDRNPYVWKKGGRRNEFERGRGSGRSEKKRDRPSSFRKQKYDPYPRDSDRTWSEKGKWSYDRDYPQSSSDNRGNYYDRRNFNDGDWHSQRNPSYDSNANEKLYSRRSPKLEYETPDGDDDMDTFEYLQEGDVFVRRPLLNTENRSPDSNSQSNNYETENLANNSQNSPRYDWDKESREVESEKSPDEMNLNNSEEQQSLQRSSDGMSLIMSNYGISEKSEMSSPIKSNLNANYMPSGCPAEQNNFCPTSPPEGDTGYKGRHDTIAKLSRQELATHFQKSKRFIGRLQDLFFSRNNENVCKVVQQTSLLCPLVEKSKAFKDDQRQFIDECLTNEKGYKTDYVQRKNFKNDIARHWAPILVYANHFNLPVDEAVKDFINASKFTKLPSKELPNPGTVKNMFLSL